MSRPSAGEQYELHHEIARGGMAAVHLGRRLGAAGFTRTVAIKRMHQHLALDPAFVAMFIDEARIASFIQHPNVVSTLDVVHVDDELLLVLEYIEGISLHELLRRSRRMGRPIPSAVICGIMIGALLGLHAAHEARDEEGHGLNIVHRDVSPQNVLVGADGVARIIDFGIAKAASRSTTTQDGNIKGKLRYMAPEQLRAEELDRRADVFAAGVVMWEMLTGQRLFEADDAPTIGFQVLAADIAPPSSVEPTAPNALDAVVLRALDRNPLGRHASARAFALAIEAAHLPASTLKVGAWVEELAGPKLTELRKRASATEQANRPPEGLMTVDSTGLISTSGAAAAEPDTMETVATETSTGSPGPRRFLGAAIAAIVAGAAVAWFTLSPPRPTTPAPGVTGSALVIPPPVRMVPTAAQPSASAAQPSVPAPSTSAPAPGPTGAAASVPPPPRVVLPPRPVPARRDPPPTPNCAPNYYFADGKKHFKPECF